MMSANRLGPDLAAEIFVLDGPANDNHQALVGTDPNPEAGPVIALTLRRTRLTIFKIELDLAG
jgi:hypothetical protein